MVLPQSSGRSGGGDASGAGVLRVPFDQKFRALAKVFELAGGETKVDFPICNDCAAEVHKEMDAQLAELQAECAAYQEARQRLEAEGAQPLDERQFQRELRRLQDEEAQEQ